MSGVMFGFAEYCKEIGRVQFSQHFSSFLINCSVLGILASTALRSLHFLFKPRFKRSCFSGLLSCFLFDGVGFYRVGLGCDSGRMFSSSLSSFKAFISWFKFTSLRR